MQRNFILTDVMKTGDHPDLEKFINFHSMENQSFTLTGEYYTMHDYDLDSFDRKFAIIDCRKENHRIANNKEFNAELKRRCDLLHSQGFVFIKANPWESLENITRSPQYPVIELPHVKWTGGVSWFWFYMYQKHKDKKYNFTHDHHGSYWHKKYDFLYLNKISRPHRDSLYDKLMQTDVLSNSLYTKWPDKKLPSAYELPWAKDYPAYGMDQDLYELPYIDTVCSIVSETNDNDHEVFMTEKIWKPILAEQVFIVHGNYLYLQKLREIGFKTFGAYFNESYDLEKDPGKRIDKIVELCTDLKHLCDDGTDVNRGNKKWQDIYLQSQALRKHNLDTFWNKDKLSEQVNKTLGLFLEFADGSEIPS